MNPVIELTERINETEKILANETPKSIPGLLFQVLENQRIMMEYMVRDKVNPIKPFNADDN